VGHHRFKIKNYAGPSAKKTVDAVRIKINNKQNIKKCNWRKIINK
jgi:hypothetical protein